MKIIVEVSILLLIIFLGIGWFIYNSLRHRKEKPLTVKEIEQEYLKGKEFILSSLREDLANEFKKKTKEEGFLKRAIDMKISMIGKMMDEIAETQFKWNEEVQANIAVKKYRLIKKFYKNIAGFIFDSFRAAVGPEEIQNQEWYKIWDYVDQAQTKIEVEEVIDQMARETNTREEIEKE